MGVGCCSTLQAAHSRLLKPRDLKAEHDAGVRLLECFACGDLGAAHALLDEPLDVGVRSPRGSSALHAAVGAGDAESCERILHIMPSLANATDCRGASALHRLAQAHPPNGRDIFRLLIRAKVDDALKDVDGYEAVDLAANGDEEVFRLLEFRRVNTRPKSHEIECEGVTEASAFLEKYRQGLTSGVMNLGPAPKPARVGQPGRAKATSVARGNDSTAQSTLPALMDAR